MSAPQASTTRQRGGKSSTDPEVLNPASLGTTSNKNVRRSKPNVDPPFWNMTMNKFLTYLTLSLLAVLGFYVWRFTVWAHQAGGYWNLVTGKGQAQNLNPNINTNGGGGGVANAAMLKSAASVASAAGSAASKAGKNSAIKSGKGQSGSEPQGDVQGRIFALASALGVTPHDLTAAIRPLIDPSVPNPIEAAAKEIEMLKLQLQTLAAGGAQAQPQAAAEPVKEAASEGSLLGIVSEVLLD